MANFNIEFFSNELRRPVNFKMFIPNDPNTTFGAPPPSEYGMKTIFLLHGYTGGADNWLPMDLCLKYNIAVVAPNGENAFWIDGQSSGHNFGKFLTSELVEYVRKTFGLAKTPEDTYIMGMSMGGFGALHSALMCPDTFGKAIALSPALIIYDVLNMAPGTDNGMGNYEYYTEVFGDLTKVDKTANNPEVLVDKLLSEGKALPDMYIAIGTEDFLLENDRIFKRFLDSRDVNFTYIEDSGMHDMDFWNKYARIFLTQIFEG
ncbi:MAG: esterase [Saccharofermentans sp.]|nr:esterase [Saccharofermentans sp.]